MINIATKAAAMVAALVGVFSWVVTRPYPSPPAAAVTASWYGEKYRGRPTASGELFNACSRFGWLGQRGFGAGDTVELLLDCDAGWLAVKLNGRL